MKEKHSITTPVCDLKQPSAEPPSLADFADYIANPIWTDFSGYLMDHYQTKPVIQYSRCTMAPGWNVKFKKSGKNLCTIYPFQGHLKVMVVIGPNEKESITALLPTCSPEFLEVYTATQESQGQRWLMLQLSESGPLYEDIKAVIHLRLLTIRRKKQPGK